MMKFQLLDHLCEDMEKFGSIRFLNASAYE